MSKKPLAYFSKEPVHRYGLDNRYHRYNCPGVMDDSRIFTSYIPNQTLIDIIKYSNNLGQCYNDNNDFRLFMQQNGVNIMDRERSFLEDNYSCNFSGKCGQCKNCNKFTTCKRSDGKGRKRGTCRCYYRDTC